MNYKKVLYGKSKFNIIILLILLALTSISLIGYFYNLDGKGIFVIFCAHFIFLSFFIFNHGYIKVNLDKITIYKVYTYQIFHKDYFSIKRTIKNIKPNRLKIYTFKDKNKSITIRDDNENGSEIEEFYLEYLETKKNRKSQFPFLVKLSKDEAHDRLLSLFYGSNIKLWIDYLSNQNKKSFFQGNLTVSHEKLKKFVNNFRITEDGNPLVYETDYFKIKVNILELSNKESKITIKEFNYIESKNVIFDKNLTSQIKYLLDNNLLEKYG